MDKINFCDYLIEQEVKNGHYDQQFSLWNVPIIIYYVLIYNRNRKVSWDIYYTYNFRKDFKYEFQRMWILKYFSFPKNLNRNTSSQVWFSLFTN